jgi:hypothetical protein
MGTCWRKCMDGALELSKCGSCRYDDLKVFFVVLVAAMLTNDHSLDLTVLNSRATTNYRRPKNPSMASTITIAPTSQMMLFMSCSQCLQICSAVMAKHY